jgi:hypothetical protein
MKSVLFVLLLIPIISNAHHSFGTNFDLSKNVEIEGEVIEIIWRNPHIRLVIIAAGEHWEIEGQSSSQLARIGVNPSQISIGDVVKVAGPPSRNRPKSLHWGNLLLTDGREVVMRPASEPRWSENVLWDISIGQQAPQFSQ